MKVTKEIRVRVNENGGIVIPVSFRRALRIDSGDTVVLRIEEDELRITTLPQRLAKAQQWVRQYVAAGRSLADELIAERRETVRRE